MFKVVADNTIPVAVTDKGKGGSIRFDDRQTYFTSYNKNNIS